MGMAASTVIQMGPCEFETDALEAADVLLVDNWFQITGSAHSPVAILHKEGKLQQEDTTELRYVVAGMAEGRQSEEQQVMYCSLGFGAMDMIIANQIYKNAKEMGIGQKLMLWDALKWV